MHTAVKPTRTFSDELLSRYRQQGDPPADAVIGNVVETGGREGLSRLMRWLADPTASPAGQPVVVQQFFAEHNRLPNWADRARMARGMAFFGRHAGAIGLVLGTYSLPYTYLGANGVQVLWLTERIKTDTARRLQETGEWVFAVTNPKQWATGEAVLRTLKIRLIHAASRWFAEHSGRWQAEWGTPVNQEDMAGTSLAFSYVVLRGLRKLGISATEPDEEDYLHHINVVNAINGVAEDLTAQNLREAFHLDRLIARRQFRPSEAGRGLTKALLNAIAEVSAAGAPAAGAPVGKRATTSGAPRLRSDESVRNLAAAQMRFFLGDEYANGLDIPAVPLEKRLVNVVSRLPIFPKLIPVPSL